MPAVLGGVVVCLALAAPARAQEVEDLTGAIEKYRGILAVAVQKLEDLELPEALAGFTEVIDAYKTGKLSTATPLTRQIVGQAQEGRARTFANLGRNAETESDYEALVRFDLTWPVDRTRTSPKILAIYDKVRARLVGTLAVQTEPPGARVSLDNDPLGRSPMFDREVLAGTYTLRVEAEGFETHSEAITVAGGARAEKAVRLIPNARGVILLTSPPGARVNLDGKERGITFGEAGQEYAEAAAALGLTPSQISAPLLVENVPPGTRLLKIEKECHEPQLLSIDVALDPNDSAPLKFSPIRLTPSLGAISLESSPSTAEIILDGKASGRTPARLDELCSGSHDLILKLADTGQWIGSVQVAKGQKSSVKETLRMTLAYVGMAAAGPAGQPPAGERELGEALARLTHFNVLRPGSGLPDELMARRRPEPEAAPSPDYLASVAGATGADIIAVSRPGQGAFGKIVELILRSARFPIEDRLTVSLENPDQVKELLARLDAETPLTRPWLGVSAIETHRSSNPLVIRVAPGSPAEKAGVKVGETVVSLGGADVAAPRDLEDALGRLREGAQASLMVQARGSQPRVLNISVGSTAVLPDAPDSGRLRSRLAAELWFKERMETAMGRTGGLQRNVALLGLGALLMQSGLNESALRDALERVDLPPGAGLSSGAVSYLRGLCLQSLGRQQEAKRQFELAAAQADATLGSNDGPPVSERARRALASSSGS